MTAARPRLFVSAGIFLDAKGHTLVTQRPEGKPLAGFWEFPGGKTEPGENAKQTLKRELLEELGVRVHPADMIPFYPVQHSCPDFELIMLTFLIPHWEGTFQALENQAMQWVAGETLARLKMPEPDLPLIPKLRRFMEDSTLRENYIRIGRYPD